MNMYILAKIPKHETPDMGDAINIALMSILVVIIILLAISLLINVLRFLPRDEIKNSTSSKTSAKKSNTYATMADIKDEDMLVAAMTATIDAAEEDNDSDYRLKSIKQIS